MRRAGLSKVLALLSVIVAPNLLSQRQPAEPSPPPASREIPLDHQVIQVLNRLTFGPRPGDLAKVRAIGVDNWAEEQLHPDRIADTTIETFIANYPKLNANQTELLERYAADAQRLKMNTLSRPDTLNAIVDTDTLVKRIGQERTELLLEIQSARVARAVGSQRQLQEVMTDFWENHFNVAVAKTGIELYYLKDFDERVIRPNALGKFRDLLRAVAKSPAMLVYLDNSSSMAESGRHVVNASGAMRVLQSRGGLNENYGRELLELHTLGVDGGFTQQDVINVARTFTGWTIKTPAQGGGFLFRPEWHDSDEKIVLGHRLPAGRGIEDGEDVLTLLAKSPATARFIAFKLARRFVCDSPSKTLVDRAAQVYLTTDGDIREVLRTIITSPEFFSEQAFRSKVKSPFEVVVSTARALGASPDNTPKTAQLVASLGQPIFGHQAPDGWPETGDAWMNTGAILNRINFGTSVMAGRLPGIDIRLLPALDSVRAASRDQQVEAVIATVLNGMASSDMRAVLFSGQNPLVPKAAENTPNELAGIVGLALGSPEFQRH